MGPIRALRSLGNIFGLTWWAKIETTNPNATYWFGPFLTRRSLKVNLSKFIEDLLEEGTQSVNHRFIRCRRSEPLTS
tara:strand:+ start:60154 stop:60384 length:231 start_codon:yes stop_codon:yes gene_type:complete